MVVIEIRSGMPEEALVIPMTSEEKSSESR
jgi:hypothetical protein